MSPRTAHERIGEETHSGDPSAARSACIAGNGALAAACTLAVTDAVSATALSGGTERNWPFRSMNRGLTLTSPTKPRAARLLFDLDVTRLEQSGIRTLKRSKERSVIDGLRGCRQRFCSSTQARCHESRFAATHPAFGDSPRVGTDHEGIVIKDGREQEVEREQDAEQFRVGVAVPNGGEDDKDLAREADEADQEHSACDA
jgi:hypothetical protein